MLVYGRLSKMRTVLNFITIKTQDCKALDTLEELYLFHTLHVARHGAVNCHFYGEVIRSCQFVTRFFHCLLCISVHVMS